MPDDSIRPSTHRQSVRGALPTPGWVQIAKIVVLGAILAFFALLAIGWIEVGWVMPDNRAPSSPEAQRRTERLGYAAPCRCAVAHGESRHRHACIAGEGHAG